MKAMMQKPADESARHTLTHPAGSVSSPPSLLPVPTGIHDINRRRMKNPRAEHRQAQRQRVDEAQRLVEKFPELTALKGNLEFVDREGASRATEMKYSANLEHLKSVLVFTCPVPECTGGDFDLTVKLAEAVAKRRPLLTGEMPCLGTHKKASGKVIPCRRVLHYTLKLAYSKRR
jgi:hypothetical protein